MAVDTLTDKKRDYFQAALGFSDAVMATKTLTDLEKEFFEAEALGWQDWVPVLTPAGTMTLTPGAHAGNHARYKVTGKLCIISYSQLLTVGGVVNTSMLVSLPVNAATPRNTGLCDAFNGVPMRCTTADAVNSVYLQKADATNFPAGATHVSFYIAYQIT